MRSWQGRPLVGPRGPTGALAVTAAGSTVAVPTGGGTVDVLDSRTERPTRRARCVQRRRAPDRW